MAGRFIKTDCYLCLQQFPATAGAATAIIDDVERVKSRQWQQQPDIGQRETAG